MDRPQVLEPLLPAVQSDGGEGKADEPCPLEMFLAWLRPLTGTPQRYCRCSSACALPEPATMQLKLSVSACF